MTLLANCGCHNASADETTRSGGNIFIVEVEKAPRRTIAGTVSIGGDSGPLENALVEIFDNPNYLLDESNGHKNPKQKRIAACVTGKDGKFCFSLPDGKYELRASLSVGINVTHIYVVVDLRKGKYLPLHVQLTLGT